MQAYTQATSSRWISPNIQRHDNSTRPNHLAALLGRIAKRFLRNEGIIASRYSGCAWDDETERRLLSDVFSGQRGSLFS